MQYEPVVGLEVHVHLKTRTKIFCRCANRFGAEPNSLTCPVCAGYPGSLPVLNRESVNLAVRLAIALGCRINPHSTFARKNYFYADLPKGYQISQFDEPVASGGQLPLTDHDQSIALHRIHLEEDAGKLLHETPGGGALPGQSLVDFNRCGVPLVEIVSAPDLRSAAEAQDYLQTLHQVLLYTGTSDGNMEEGSLRCDANVSVRPVGRARSAPRSRSRTSTPSATWRRRSTTRSSVRSAGSSPARRWCRRRAPSTPRPGVTRPMRGKEEAHDYRYFPEPDLPPLVLAVERVESLRRALPELPWERRARFHQEYGLSLDDARLLTSSPRARPLLRVGGEAPPHQPEGDRQLGDDRGAARAQGAPRRGRSALAPERLARLVAMVDSGAVSGRGAKEVLAAIWESGEEPAAATERLGLVQVRDSGEIAVWVETVMREHPGPVAQYREGKTKALGFLVGEVMKRSSGRADPRQVRDLLGQSLARLGSEASEAVAASGQRTAPD